MNTQTTFDAFNKGTLALPTQNIPLENYEWKKHPKFEGVELKCILSTQETNGAFSFHLVHIAPHKMIDFHIHPDEVETHEVIAGSGYCINDGITLEYTPGTLSIFPKGISHKVVAGEEGLYLFAKFFSANI